MATNNQTAKYIRVSTKGQDPKRQKDSRYKNYVDICSGTIPFNKRPEAIKLIQDVHDGLITRIHVHSISRLGRNTVDILNTINFFTELGICIVTEKEGFQTLDRNKRENTTAKMVISIMATLSEFEREMILERTREGIKKAQEEGKYAANGGRPKDNPRLWITKEKPTRILKLLNRGLSIRDVAFRTKSSEGTVQKVKRIARDLDLYDYENPNEQALRNYLKD